MNETLWFVQNDISFTINQSKNVKIYRNRRNWSQAALAEYANISINFIGDIERGKNGHTLKH